MNEQKIILIVEDETYLSEIYTQTFESAGFFVKNAFSCEEAFDRITEDKPDIILLDILLPKENGIHFLRQASNYLTELAVPVVVFSNFDDPTSKEQAFELGVKDYMIKTNHIPSEILNRVNECLYEHSEE
jgi:DNA-binding response OmpR family regulator